MQVVYQVRSQKIIKEKVQPLKVALYVLNLYLGACPNLHILKE